MGKVTVLHAWGVWLCLTAGLAVGSSIALAQNDPHVGTWVLDVAKSKYSPGPAPRSQSAIYAAVGESLKVTATGTDAAGLPTTTEFTLTFDGKDHPVKGNPDFDSISARRVDSHTLEYTRKLKGKVASMATRVVSKDGNTVTLTAIGVNGRGQKISNVVVYVRK